jgi:hypothetical protein
MSECKNGKCHKEESVRDDNFWEKYILAGMPTMPSYLLAELAGDPDHSIRRRVAENPLTPSRILAKLANDEHADVRMALAENPCTPYEILVQLTDDANPIVRYDLADNPNLPRSIHGALARDENPYIARRAQLVLSRQLLEATVMAATVKAA